MGIARIAKIGSAKIENTHDDRYWKRKYIMTIQVNFVPMKDA
jgi:hypothetical protein